MSDIVQDAPHAFFYFVPVWSAPVGMIQKTM